MLVKVPSKNYLIMKKPIIILVALLCLVFKADFADTQNLNAGQVNIYFFDKYYLLEISPNNGFIAIDDGRTKYQTTIPSEAFIYSPEKDLISIKNTLGSIIIRSLGKNPDSTANRIYVNGLNSISRLEKDSCTTIIYFTIEYDIVVSLSWAFPVRQK